LYRTAFVPAPAALSLDAVRASRDLRLSIATPHALGRIRVYDTVIGDGHAIDIACSITRDDSLRDISKNALGLSG
jgi:hypothetical protein